MDKPKKLNSLNSKHIPENLPQDPEFFATQTYYKLKAEFFKQKVTLLHAVRSKQVMFFTKKVLLISSSQGCD